jgi:predicted RNA-binding protein (virulence factor B family)
MAIIGRRVTLPALREAIPGLYLDGGEAGEILLPRRYVFGDPAPGDPMEVFVYCDSEDRLVATTEMPLAMVGEFAFLKVLSVNQNVGAFLDWGLPKDLLLPFREQVPPVREGQRVVVAIYVDEKTNRIAASMRLHRHLSRLPPPYATGEAVDLLITERTPLGYNAIVENAHRGLLYHENLAAPLSVGQRIKGFVRMIRPGGKLDLSLDPSGYKRVTSLSDQILKALEQNGGRLDFDDDSPPAAIRDKFSASKKAFKQALGKLYKHRRISFEKPGIRLLDNSEWAPAEKAQPPVRPAHKR